MAKLLKNNFLQIREYVEKIGKLCSNSGERQWGYRTVPKSPSFSEENEKVACARVLTLRDTVEPKNRANHIKLRKAKPQLNQEHGISTDSLLQLFPISQHFWISGIWGWEVEITRNFSWIPPNYKLFFRTSKHVFLLWMYKKNHEIRNKLDSIYKEL